MAPRAEQWSRKPSKKENKLHWQFAFYCEGLSYNFIKAFKKRLHAEQLHTVAGKSQMDCVFLTYPLLQAI